MLTTAQFYTFLSFFAISCHTRASKRILRSWYCVRRIFRCFWAQFNIILVLKSFFRGLRSQKIKIFHRKNSKKAFFDVTLLLFGKNLWFSDAASTKKSFHTQNNVKNVLRNIKASLGYNQGQGGPWIWPHPASDVDFWEKQGGHGVLQLVHLISPFVALQQRCEVSNLWQINEWCEFFVCF